MHSHTDFGGSSFTSSFSHDTSSSSYSHTPSTYTSHHDSYSSPSTSIGHGSHSQIGHTSTTSDQHHGHRQKKSDYAADEALLLNNQILYGQTKASVTNQGLFADKKKEHKHHHKKKDKHDHDHKKKEKHHHEKLAKK